MRLHDEVHTGPGLFDGSSRVWPSLSNPCCAAEVLVNCTAAFPGFVPTEVYKEPHTLNSTEPSQQLVLW